MKLKLKKSPSKVKQTILAISIAIIFLLFIAYGIETFYESPKWEKYCNNTVNKEITVKEQCELLEGEWTDAPKAAAPIKGEITGWCNPYAKCEKEFRSITEVYNRNIFIATLIIGMIAIITGGLLLNLESVSSGIMSGGVLLLIYGTIRYWGYMSKYLRFLILGLVLIILIWIGYKKFKK